MLTELYDRSLNAAAQLVLKENLAELLALAQLDHGLNAVLVRRLALVYFLASWSNWPRASILHLKQLGVQSQGLFAESDLELADALGGQVAWLFQLEGVHLVANVLHVQRLG